MRIQELAEELIKQTIKEVNELSILIKKYGEQKRQYKKRKKRFRVYKANLLAWTLYWAMQRKENEDLQKCVDQMQKEIEEQEKANKKFEMMREHPEWFETTSPKQYGMNLKNRKHGRH